MDQLQSHLQRVGLKDKEAKVYLALLRLGKSKVTAISQESGLLRTTTYETLKNLVRKGFVSSFDFEKVQHFIAANPRRVLEDLDARMHAFKEVLPTLDAYKNTTLKPFEVEHFEGKAGVRSILHDTLTSKEILVFGNFKSFKDHFTYEEEKYVRERVEKGIPLRMLSEISDATTKLKEGDSVELREVRFIEEYQDTPSEVFIYGDKLAFITYAAGDLHGAIVSNGQVAKLMKNHFEALWKCAKIDPFKVSE